MVTQGQLAAGLRLAKIEPLLAASNLEQNEVSFPYRGTKCAYESGLYKIIMRSDKPQASTFQDWVSRNHFGDIDGEP